MPIGKAIALAGLHNDLAVYTLMTPWEGCNCTITEGAQLPSVSCLYIGYIPPRDVIANNYNCNYTSKCGLATYTIIIIIAVKEPSGACSMLKGLWRINLRGSELVMHGNTTLCYTVYGSLWPVQLFPC